MNIKINNKFIMRESVECGQISYMACKICFKGINSHEPRRNLTEEFYLQQIYSNLQQKMPTNWESKVHENLHCSFRYTTMDNYCKYNLNFRKNKAKITIMNIINKIK